MSPFMALANSIFVLFPNFVACLQRRAERKTAINTDASTSGFQWNVR
jgi:hypothetical protein